MEISLARWEARVRDAALAGDRARLLALYDEGVRDFGTRARTAWAEALSATDASAVTG